MECLNAKVGTSMTMFNKGNLINVPLNELVANSESVGVKFVKITKKWV
jgi:hypothetical protein